MAVVDRLRGKGATLEEMAHIMIRLGAVSALNLDGGASSAVVVKTHLRRLRLPNRPSAGLSARCPM